MTLLSADRIRHCVAFSLSRRGTPENAYAWAVSMELANRAAYDAYDAHPDHRAFVQGRWVPEVTDFVEIDLVGR